MKRELIPAPKTIQLTDEIRTHPIGLVIGDPLFENAAILMERDLKRLFPAGETSPGIALRRRDDLETEAFAIDITEDTIELFASTVTGIQHAFSALLQLASDMEGEVGFPCGHIENAPDKEYRGLMIDPARAYLPMNSILRMVDAARAFSLSVLHLHLSDDQAYTLPSREFPDLPTQGHCYSEEEIRSLTEHASMAGVELMPEIETPGHCYRLQAAYPEVFGSSGIVRLSEAALEGARKLVRETVELFPDSKRIHIGGDEAFLEKWYADEESVQYMKDHGLSTMHEAYAYFVGQIAEYVLSLGRIPVVWEGFPSKFNDLVDKRTEVFAWESYYQLAPDLLKSGFKVINASWRPMYLDLPDTYWSPTEISRFWNVYTWIHWSKYSPVYHNDLTVPATEDVIGGQLCAWDGREERYGIGKEEELRDKADKILERLGALSEKTWNADHEGKTNGQGQKLSTMASFSARYDLIKVWEIISGSGD